MEVLFEIIFGITLFTGYGIFYWFIKLVTWGRYPKRKFIIEHNEYIMSSAGIFILCLALYLVFRHEVIMYICGIIILSNCIGYLYEKHITHRIKISNMQFLGIFVLVLVVFFIIAAIIK